MTSPADPEQPAHPVQPAHPQPAAKPDLHGGRVELPRSRGAVSGILVMALGAWGALVPLLGPYADFGFTPDSAWHVSAGRLWLQILPGAAALVGGFLLVGSKNRVATSLGGWLAAAAGAWFVVGPTLRSLLHLGSIGRPIHSGTVGSALETLLLFSGLGTAILFLGATAVGRLSVVGVRDVRAAQRREGDERGRDGRV